MLTDTKIRAAKAAEKPYKLADREGLYVYVSRTGAKSWRFDYRISGKRQTLTIGRYPEVTIEMARYGTRVGKPIPGFVSRASARSMLAVGESPAKVKQRQIAQDKFASENTVKAHCERFYAERESGLSESWRSNARRWLDEDIYPQIGSKAVTEVTADDVEALVLKTAKKRGPSSGEAVRRLLAMAYASLPRVLDAGNPARDAGGARRAGKKVRGSRRTILEIPKGKPRGMPLPRKQIPELIRAIDTAPALPQTKIAAKLLLLTFTRKRELIEAPWTEFDLENGEWIIPPERMKMGRPHIVPLSRQAIECFQELKSMAFGSKFVFPHARAHSRPIGRGMLNAFFIRIGFSHFTPHSARSTASTILNAQGFSTDAIELQLAHLEQNKIRAAYNHSDRMEERRRMVQSWADYIDGLCSGANVTPIRIAAV